MPSFPLWGALGFGWLGTGVPVGVVPVRSVVVGFPFAFPKFSFLFSGGPGGDGDRF